MKYIEWRDEFEGYLSGLDEAERRRVLSYYAEMYADKRDSGLSENEAVAQFGAPYDAAQKILAGEGAKKCDNAKTDDTQEKEERAHFSSEGAVDALEINGALGNIILNFYDGEGVNVDYPATSLIDYKVGQQGGKVVITHKKIKFKGVNLKNKIIPDMIIQVPRHLTPDLEINLAAGAIKLDGGDYGNIKAYVEGGALTTGQFNCSDAQFITDAGKIEIGGAVCHRMHAEINAGKLHAGSIYGSTADIRVNAGKLNVDETDCKRTEICVSAGKAEITLCGAKEDYDAEVKKVLSSCNLDSRSVNCERSVKAEVSLGSLTVNFTQAT